jgi:hypothetical protein
MCKSTVDWCEKNYEVTRYIAEFWNTISGISIMISSIYFYINLTKYKEYFLNMTIKLISVSIGTILFHSTLLYKYQLLDEIPMILVVIEYIKILKKLKTAKLIINDMYILCIEFLIIMCLPVVCLLPFTYSISDKLQKFSFMSVFLGYAGILLWMLKQLSNGLNKCVYNEINRNNDNDINRNTVMKISMMTNQRDNIRSGNMFKLKEVQNNLKKYIENRKKMSVNIKRGITMGIMSISVWIIERLMCKYVDVLQLHAWWHVLSSLGIYNLNNIVLQHVIINEQIIVNEQKIINEQLKND